MLLILGADKATVYYIIYLHNPVVISCLVNTVTLVIRTHKLIYCLLRALSSILVFGSLLESVIYKQYHVQGQGRRATGLRWADQ